ncbi:hypothetical protein [Chromobacterium sp. CV08]|uniref:hypothetical protein n=1 Tax=Chromobacterium sp. CV08 TaxID=3133274 RepID=UPI003DA923FA
MNGRNLLAGAGLDDFNQFAISGALASDDWKLMLSHGRDGMVMEVGGSFLFVFSLAYKGQASRRQMLQVKADNAVPFEKVPAEIEVLSNGLAQLPLVAVAPGKATIIVTHVGSGASFPLHIEVLAADSRKYRLELQKPADGKLILNRQDAIRIGVQDAAGRTPATVAVKVMARIDAERDTARIEFDAKTAETRDGVAEFLAMPKAVGTSSVVFETDPATLAAPLTVALTAQTGTRQTQLRISPEEVTLPPDSLEDKQPIHVFFDPPPADRPKTIAFTVLDKVSTLRVRQGELQLLSGHLNVGADGETVLRGLQVGAETPGTILRIQFSAEGARACVLNVKIAGGATSARRMPAAAS